MKIRMALAAGLMLTAVSVRAGTRPAVKAAGAQTPPQRVGGALFAVIIGPGPRWKKGQPLRRGVDPHYRYWQNLFRQGRVTSAGPVGQDTGFALLRAGSQSEANRMLAADPAVKTGQFRSLARPYVPSLTVTTQPDGGE